MTKKKAEVETQSAAKLESNGFMLDEPGLRYINEVGIAFKKAGMARVGGRIIGLLLLAEQPMSVDEIAAALKVSRTAIVTNLQVGIAIGLIEIASRYSLGDHRREYYQIGVDGWEKSLKNGETQVKDMLELAQAGLRIVASDNYAARRRLREMEALYEFTMEWYASFEEGWARRRAELNFD